MRSIVNGVACAGCPHRAAYVMCKEAVGRGRGKLLCGDAGCAAVGALHPAATTCPGGEPELLDRYRKPVPTGTPEAPALEVCVHFIPDTQLADETATTELAGLAGEGRVTILAVLASSRAFLSHDALEGLAARARDVGCADAAVVDPLDSVRAMAVVTDTLAHPGVHAILFASPCAQLLRDTPAAAPVEIDPYACVGCQRCKQITGCPALVFDAGAYRVEAGVCAGCDLCVNFCRTHVIYSPRDRMAPEQRAQTRYAAATR